MSNLPKLSPEVIQAYQNEISRTSSSSTIKRKSVSLNKFFDWAEQNGKLDKNPMAQTPVVNNDPSNNVLAITPKPKKNIGFKTFTTAGITVCLIILIFLLTRQLSFPIPFISTPAKEIGPTSQITNIIEDKNQPQQVASPSSIPANSAVIGSWNLYAKLKLTSSSGVPQVGSQTLNFKLYNSDQGGTPLYTSTPQTITTDTNGSALVSLSNVPTELFFQNNKLFLEPTLSGNSSASASIRIPVSTASTPSNLNGYLAANPATGAGEETVPVINSDGQLLLASQAPAVIAKQGNFLLQGQAVTIKTADGSDGNIEINPDGKGIAHFLFEGSSGNFLNAQGPNLTSGSLYYGMVPNNATGYNLINLQSGSHLTTKFSVDAIGNTFIKGNENVVGNIATNGTDRLTSTGALKNITGYSQNSGNFTVNQNPGDFASIVKNGTALSDVLTLTLDERPKPQNSNTTYSTLVLNRYDGAAEAMALLVDNGNAQFNGLLRLGQYASAPSMGGVPGKQAGNLFYNTSDNKVYYWNGSSWLAFVTGASTFSGSFADLTGGTNTGAAMVVGTGASLNFTGSGTINASSLNSLTSSQFLRSDTSTNFTSGVLTTNAGTTLNAAGTFQLGGTTVNSTASELNFLHGTTVTAGGVIYGNGTILSNTGAGTTGQILVSNGASAPSWGNIASSLTAGTDISITGTTNATISDTSTLNSVTNRGATTSNAVSVGNLTSTGTTTFGGITYTWPASQTSNYVLQTNGTGTLSWVDPAAAAAASIYWTQASGALFPKSNTVDVLIGASSTASAKFAFTNVLTGTPTATIAGTVANVATYLTGDGNLATTNMSDLTLGSASTGNVILNSRGATSLTANGANLTASGTFTLPNSNTLTGVAGYVQNSAGYSVGGATTYHFDSSGNLVANDVAANGGNLTTTAATGNLFNTGATTVNVGGAATTLNLQGAGSGTINIGNGTGTTAVNITTGTGSQTNTSSVATGTNTAGAFVFNDAALTTGDEIYATASAITSGNILKLGQGGNTNFTGNVIYGDIDNSGQGGIGFTGNFLKFDNATATKFTLSSAGTVTLAGNILPNATNTSNIGSSSLLQFNNTYSKAFFQNGNAVCDISGANCPAGSTNYWQLNGTVLSPGNSTYDLTIGGTATGSAFQVFGVENAAGDIAKLNGTTITTGNLLEATASGITSGNLIKLGQGGDTPFTGSAILADLGNTGAGGGSFTGNFETFKNNTVTKYSVDSSGNVTAAGNVAVNGGSLTTTQTTANLFNATATTLNIGGAATTVSLGAATGTTTINNASTIAAGNLTVQGTTGITESGVGAGLSFSGTGNHAISASNSTSNVSIDAGNSGVLQLNGATAGDVQIAGGSGATGCTIANATGTLTCSGDLSTNNGNLTTSGATGNVFNATATTVNIGGAATTINVGPTGASGSLVFSGGSGDTGCTLDGTTGKLLCSGEISTTATSGTQGWWQLNNKIISPANSTFDLAVGGTATGSAFQVFGIQNAAGDIAKLNGTTVTTGNLLEATASGITSGNLIKLGQGGDTPFTGSAILADLGLTGAGGGSFTGDFLTFKNNTATKFSVNSAGTVTVAGNIIPSVTDTSNIGTSGGLEFNNIYGKALFQNGNAVCDSTGTNCPSGAGLWAQTLGALYPTNNTVDLLIGGSATTSAKFAFTGVTGGLPTASVSGNVANVATYLTGNGDLATTNMADLVLGSATTGNIIISSRGSTSLTANAANLTASGTFTLPNSNTLTGVAGYVQNSAGYSVGGATTYHFDSSGNIVANDVAANGGNLTTTAATGNLFNTNATTVNLGGAATTALNIGNGNSAYTAINIGSGTGGNTINIAGTGATGSDTVNIATGGTGADTINIGNSASTTALNVTTGTGSQTFTSSVATGTNTTGAFVFKDAALSTGDLLYATASAITSGNILKLGQGGNTNFTGNLIYGDMDNTGQGGIGFTGNFLKFDNATATKFTLNSAGTMTLAGNILPNLTDTSNIGSSSALEFNNVYAKAFFQNGNAVCDASGTNCPSGSGIWAQTLGAIYPVNNTVDLLIGASSGATATQSAKFAFTGVNSGTPTASIAGSVANVATYLTGNGTLATTNMNDLTLGSSTTGNVIINSRGTNTITANGSSTTVAGDLNSSAATAALFNTTTTTLSIGSAATTLNLTGAGSATLNIGNGTGTTAVNVTSGTGSQTFTSSVATGTNTTGAFVFKDAALTTGDLIYATASAITSGNILKLGQGGDTNFTGNAIFADLDSTGQGGIGFTGNFELFKNAGVTKYTVDSTGSVTAAGNLTVQGTTGATFSGTGAGIAFSGTGNHAISASNSTSNISIDAGNSGVLQLNGATAGDVQIAGGSGATGCTIANSTGNITCSGDVAANGGNLTTTAATGALFNTNATTVNIGGAATTINVGPTGASGAIAFSGGSADTGCTLDGTTGNFTCSENITTTATSGTQGWWQLTNKILSPANSTYDLTIGSNATGAAFQVFGIENAAGDIAKLNGTTITTGNLLEATASGITSGNLIKLGQGGDTPFTGSAILADLGLTGAGGSGFTGNFLTFKNNTATKFSVSSAGTVTVAGNILPSVTDVSNIGSSSLLEFNNIYGKAFFQNGNAVCDASGTNCPSGSGLWGQALGALYPTNNTVDLLIGGSATTSAKFAFKNVLTGTPTASIAGSVANVATYLTGDGTLATTNMADLTLGGSTTGNVVINSRGTNTITANGNSTTVAGDLNSSAATAALFNTTTTSLSIGSAATTLNLTGAGSATLNIGNGTGTTAVNVTSGTGSQTFTSSVATGTNTTGAFVFKDAALTTGDEIYATASAITSGNILKLGQGGNTNFTGNVIYGDIDNSGQGGIGFTGNFLKFDNATATKFTVNSAGTMTLAGNILPSVNNTSNIGSSSSLQFNNIYAQVFTQNGNLVCDASGANCPSGAGLWQLVNKIVSPSISSYDLTIGGTATGSAFQVFGIENAAGDIAKLNSTVITTGNVFEATASAITSGNIIKLGEGGDGHNFTGNAIFADLDNTGGGSFTGNFVRFDNAASTKYTVDASGNETAAGNLTIQGTTGGTFSGASANISFSGAGVHSVSAANSASDLAIDAGNSAVLKLNGSTAGDVQIAGGSAGTGCTITNVSGNLTCTGDIAATSGNFTTTASTGNIFTAVANTTVNLGPAGAVGTIALSGGSADTGCTLDGTTGKLICSGEISTTATSGTQGWWQLNNKIISPANSTFDLTVGGTATGSAFQVFGIENAAGDIAKITGTTITTGNLFEATASGLTSGNMFKLGQGGDTPFTGNAILADLGLTGAGGGSFTGRFIELKNNTAEKFYVDYAGNMFASGNGTFTGDVAVNGGSLTTTNTTGNLFNTNATTLNIGGAATTALNIGAGTGAYTAINLGTGNGGDTINIGTGTGTNTVNIGNTAGLTTANLSSNATTQNIMTVSGTSLTTGNFLALNTDANRTGFAFTNQDANIAGQKDQTQIANIKNTFVYDTTKDPDGGLWTNDDRAKSSSWYNEAINHIGSACILGTDTRCGRREFPTKAILVATTTNLYIYDAKDNTLWMAFNKGTGATEQMIGPTTNSTGSSVYGLNGKVYFGNNGTVGGLYVIDFTNDGARKYNATDDYVGVQSIANRNTTATWNAGPSSPISNTVVASVKATMFNGKEFVAVSNATGVSVINQTDRNVYSYSDVTSDSYATAMIDNVGDLWALNSTSAQLERWNSVVTDSASELNGTPDAVWDETGVKIAGAGAVAGPTLNAAAPTITTEPDGLYVTTGTSTVDGKSDTAYVANSLGVTAIQDKKGDESKGSSKFITNSYISEDMIGDIRGMWPMDVDAARTATYSGTVAQGAFLGDVSVKADNIQVAGGSPALASGVRNKAVTFDGTAYASCTDAACGGTTKLDIGTGSWSLGAWINTTKSPNQTIIAKGNASTQFSYELHLSNGGAPIFDLYNNTAGATPTNYMEASSSANINDGNWHHVVGTYDGTTIKIYSDGILKASSTTTTGTQVTDSTSDFQVGARTDTPAFGFIGQIDEPFVTATALTVGQVRTMFQTGFRALQNHTASRVTGVTGADTYQRLHGNAAAGTTTTNNAVSVVVDSGNQFLFAGLNDTVGNTGGVTVLGLDSDTTLDLYDGTANTIKKTDSNTQFSANDNVSVSVTGFPCIGYNAGNTNCSNKGVIAIAGIDGVGNNQNWMETSDTSLYSTLASLTSPTSVKNAMTVNNTFQVFNNYNTLTSATTGETIKTPAMSVDSNGYFTYNFFGPATNATAMNLTDAVTTTGTTFSLTQSALTTGKALSITAGSALTTGTILDINSASYNQTAAGTGSLANFALTDASSNTAGNTIVNGVNIAATLNTTGATGTKEFNAYNVAAPTITGCTGGNCSWSGFKVNTLTAGPLATLTSYGVNVAATGISAGTLSGLNVSGITAGAGTEHALDIGSGWDADIALASTTPKMTIGDGGTLAITDNNATPHTLVQISDNGTVGRIQISDSLQVGTLTTQAYSTFGTATTNHSFTSAGDVVVTGNTEINGVLYLDGGNIANSLGTSTINFPADPTAVNSLNNLTNGVWQVSNTVNNGIAALIVNQAKATPDIFVASAAGTNRFKIANNGTVTITTTNAASTASLQVNDSSGTGLGKIDAGTVDPPYTINGQKYATYLPSMVGVREEVTGQAKTSEYIPGVGYRYVVDFNNLPTGSDLWLFGKATNVIENMSKVVALLTPSTPTKTWYEVDKNNNRLIVYSASSTDISYRLSAPRFDSANWSNTRDANSESVGFIINSPDNPITIVDNINPTKLSDFVISKANDGSYVLKDVTGTIIDGIESIGNFVAANIKAGAIQSQEIATTSFTAFQGTIDNLLVTTKLVTPVAQVKLISPLADQTDINIKLGSDATPEGKLAIQNAQGTEVASIDTQGNATFSGEVYAANIHSTNLDQIQATLAQVQSDQNLLKQAQSWNTSTATNSAILDQIAVSTLYVTGQAAMNSVSVAQTATIGTDLVLGSTPNSINTLSAPLEIQSLALAPVNIMGGLVSIDTRGNVAIAGNLNVAGRIKSSGLTLKDNAVLDAQATATESASLLSLQDDGGNVVSTVNASGAANFSSIAASQFVVAAGTDATNSAIVNGVITTNATAGSATIPSGVSEITIRNAKVTDYTLVYVTPTSSTQNNVLYVKSKSNGEFVVGFTSPIPVDAKFNWWIVQIQ